MINLYHANNGYDGGCDNPYNELLDRWINGSNKKIIIGNKRFKFRNCLLKRGNKDFSKIAIEARKSCLCGLSLFLQWGTRGRFDKALWREDTINNQQSGEVNLRVIGVARVLFEFGYTMSQLKNLKDKGRRWKKICQDAQSIIK